MAAEQPKPAFPVPIGQSYLTPLLALWWYEDEFCPYSLVLAGGIGRPIPSNQVTYEECKRAYGILLEAIERARGKGFRLRKLPRLTDPGSAGAHDFHRGTRDLAGWLRKILKDRESVAMMSGSLSATIAGIEEGGILNGESWRACKLRLYRDNFRHFAYELRKANSTLGAVGKRRDNPKSDLEYLLSWAESQKQRGKGRKHPATKLKDQFNCESARVLFKGKNIGVPAGHAVSVFRKMLKRFGQIVRHKVLDVNSVPGKGSDQLRQSISKIKIRIKTRHLPYKVDTTRGEGYGLMPKD